MYELVLLHFEAVHQDEFWRGRYRATRHTEDATAEFLEVCRRHFYAVPRTPSPSAHGLIK